MKFKTVGYDEKLVKYMLLSNADQHLEAQEKYKSLEIFYKSTAVPDTLRKMSNLHQIMLLDFIPVLKKKYNFNSATISRLIKDYYQMIYANSGGKINVFTGKLVIKMMADAEKSKLSYPAIIDEILIPIFQKAPVVLDLENTSYLETICDYLTSVSKISVDKASNSKFYKTHWLLVELESLSIERGTVSIKELSKLFNSLRIDAEQFGQLNARHHKLVPKINFPLELSPRKKLLLIKIALEMDQQDISPVARKVSLLINFNFGVKELNTIYQTLQDKGDYHAIVDSLRSYR